jgi:predicted dehydrogenase
MESVPGFLSNVLFEREVEDTATAFFRFAAGPHAVLNVTHAASEGQDTLEIFGSKGSIHVPVLNAGEITIKAAAGVRIERHHPGANFHQPLIDDFSNAVLEDRKPTVDGAIGREVNRILRQIYEKR